MIDIPKITVKNLPIEAIETLKRIKIGKPFPYYKDGSVFRNRQNKLPKCKDLEYYREFTVKTPGRSDRGPRRIITGKNGEAYYNEDHYQTFMEIVE